jgi:hypothetical protein
LQEHAPEPHVRIGQRRVESLRVSP